jgi:competence protein ComEC
MVLWNPMTLLYDVGFQLSFLATLGLILVGNKIVSFVKFLPEKLGIREACAMTLSAQIFALPIILTNFGRFSLISPVANILIVPFIPFAMFFGFIAAILSIISFNAGFVFAMPAWLMLQVAIFITKLLASLPMAAYEVEWFNYYCVVAYYLICVLAYFVYKYFRPVFLCR